MKLSLLGLAMGLASQAALAAPYAPPLQDKQAFIEHLITQMTEAEKIGQLRLISIGPEMPHEKIREEIAAGRIGVLSTRAPHPKTARCRTRPCAAA